MRRLLLLFIVLLCVLTPASAQNQTGYPLPDNLQTITPDNATHLVPLASIGGDLPGGLAWSPDGKTLAVGTTGGVRAYDASNWDARPQNIPGWKDVRFDSDGNLISDNKVINVTTGAVIGEDVQKTPSGKTSISYRTDGGKSVVVLTDITTGRETALNTGLTGTIEHVVFSPDEQFAALQTWATGDQDHQYPHPTAQLWNLATVTLIASLDMYIPADYVNTIGFHHNGDLLVLGTYTQSDYGNNYSNLYIWNGRTGKPLNTQDPSNFAAHMVNFSADDQLLAFPVLDGMSLWSDHEIGTLEYQAFLIPAFSPGGTWLTGHYPGSSEIDLWSKENALKLGKPDRILTGRDIGSMSFSPDDQLLAAEQPDDSLRIWNLQSGETSLVINDIKTLDRFSPNSQWILGTQASSGNSALWDARTGERLMEFGSGFTIDPTWTLAAQRASYPTGVQIIAIPTGKDVHSLTAVDNYLGEPRVFDADAGRILFDQQALDTSTGQLRFSTRFYAPLPNYPFSTDWQRILKVGNVESYGSSTDEITAYVQEPVPDIDAPIGWFEGEILTPSTTPFLTPDGKYIGYITHFGSLSMTYNNQTVSRLEFRAVETGEHIAEWILPGDVEAMTFSHNRKWLVLGSNDYPDGSIQFLDLTQDLRQATPHREFIYNVNAGDGTGIVNLVFSPDDSQLALAGYTSACGDGCFESYFVKTWDVHLLLDTPLGETFSLRIPGVHAPIFSADNKYLLVTEAEGTNGVLYPGGLQVWDTDRRKQIASLTGDDGIGAFSPDSHLLAVHEGENTLLYDVAALKQGSLTPLAIFADLDKPVKQLAFNPAGTILYVLSDNRLWLYGVKP